MERYDSVVQALDPQPQARPVSVDPDFAALYASQHAPMVKLATLLVDRVEVAEEVVQDAFVSVYQRWDSLDEPAAFLRTCVVNRSRDVQRRWRLFTRESAAPLSSEDEPDHLRDAIASLVPRQRTVVVLRFYEDLSIDQIASLMSVPPGTVKSLLHRALVRLREVIQ